MEVVIRHPTIGVVRMRILLMLMMMMEMYLLVVVVVVVVSWGFLVTVRVVDVVVLVVVVVVVENGDSPIHPLHPWESTMPAIILTMMMMWVMIGYVVVAVPHPLRLRLLLGREWKEREFLVIVGSFRSSSVTIDALQMVVVVVAVVVVAILGRQHHISFPRFVVDDHDDDGEYDDEYDDDDRVATNVFHHCNHSSS